MQHIFAQACASFVLLCERVEQKTADVHYVASKSESPKNTLSNVSGVRTSMFRLSARAVI